MQMRTLLQTNMFTKRISTILLLKNLSMFWSQLAKITWPQIRMFGNVQHFRALEITCPTVCWFQWVFFLIKELLINTFCFHYYCIFSFPNNKWPHYHQQDRRQEKKANKMVFSLENEKMKKESANLSKSGKRVALA